MLTIDDYRSAWESYPKNHHVSDFPLHLDIELTNKCNLKCNMCPFHGPNKVDHRKQKNMDFEFYRKIIDEASKEGVMSVKLNYGGEPLLYPYLSNAITYAKNSGIHEVQLNTNGLLLDKKKSILLLISGLDLLILSDYGFPDQVLNLVSFNFYKKQYKKKKPVIRVKAFNTGWWKYSGLCDEVQVPEYFDYCNVEEMFDKSSFECTQPWQRMLVLVDGTACKCSCGSLNDDKKLGNIKNFTIKELWTSKQMNYLRSCHEFHDTHLIQMCRKCPSRNEYIKKENENVKC